MPMRWRWPPENSCGIAVECSGSRPTSRAARATRALISAPRELPWTRSGSATIAPTRMRGSSEAYGSWKTICISPAQRPQLARGRGVEMSAPVEATACPRSGRAGGRGSGRASSCRSPTRRRGRASRPARTSKRDAVDGVHDRPTSRREEPVADREVLGDVARLEQRLAVVRRSSGGSSARAGARFAATGR